MNYTKTFLFTLAVTLFSQAHATRNNEVGLEVEASDSSRVYDLDEVIVVSQPKELHSLRNQPLSSTVFGRDQLQALQVRDLRDVALYVPAFAMPAYGSRITSSMYIRGIGSRVNNPAIGIYLDGMPLISKSAFNFHTYEIDRIDVLRGPQGTLYGQNTEGGLVRLYSKDPFRHQGTNLRMGAGTGFWRNVEVAHYNKVNEKTAFAISGFYDGQDGFFTNQTTGQHADQMNEAGGKIRVIHRPTQRTEVSLLADYQFVRQNGFPYGVIDDDGTTHDPSTNKQGTYKRNMLNTAFTVTHHSTGFDFNAATSYQYLRDYMFMDQDYMPVDYMRLEQKQLQNALIQEFAFKSTRPGRWQWSSGVYGSVQWLKTWAPVYFGEGLTAPIANGISNAMYNAMLASMAGRMVDGFMQRGMTPEAAQAAAQQAASAAIESAGGVSMDVLMEVPGVFHTPQTNFGIFHQSEFKLTDKLSATLGLRYDFSHVKIHYDTHARMAMTAHVMGAEATYTLTSFLKQSHKNDYNQLLPKMGFTWQIDENKSNVYATVSKGYRAGGFNIQMFSDVLQTELNANSRNAMRGDYDVTHTQQDYGNIEHTIAYKPEVSWNYELGTHLNLFNNLIHFDLTGFYMQVRNQQLSVMSGNYGFGRMMVNAGKSFSCGIEAALRGNAFDNHLAYAVSYSITHAAFKDYEDEITVNGAATTVSYADKRVPFIPRHTLGANADYRIDLNSNLLHAVTMGANLAGQGSTYWDEANTIKQKFYALLGAHIDADFGLLTLSLWGRNLTDSSYNTFVVQSAASGTSYNFAQQGNPLQVGFDLRLKF